LGENPYEIVSAKEAREGEENFQKQIGGIRPGEMEGDSEHKGTEGKDIK
jgi:hypothetical protein